MYNFIKKESVMDRKNILEYKIEKLRKLMYDIIDKEGNLLSQNVIEVSKKLDKLLNEYDSKVL